MNNDNLLGLITIISISIFNLGLWVLIYKTSKASSGNKTVRVSLSELSFKILIRGGQVSIKSNPNVIIILKDIGWDNMKDLISEAQYGGIGTFKEESGELNEHE
ncbi:MAG: hypothetical protein KAI26_04170 [Nanoarchaeota archaeon]|nr:hypothetical protein [Nanoarchaeota archaeon]